MVAERDRVSTFLTTTQRQAVQTHLAACRVADLRNCDEPGATASWAVNKGPFIVLRDFDDAGAGFSFQQGGLVQVTDETRIRFLPERDPHSPFAAIDFVLDLPHGLLTNNSSVTRGLNGKAGVQDVGKKALTDVKEAPRRGYRPFLESDDIKEGHTYCFLTADAAHYAKLHVIRFDKERRVLEFTWQYQPGATNRFE
jgi:hypothetical protein